MPAHIGTDLAEAAYLENILKPVVEGLGGDESRENSKIVHGAAARYFVSTFSILVHAKALHKHVVKCFSSFCYFSRAP